MRAALRRLRAGAQDELARDPPLAVDFGELDSVQEKRGGVCHTVACHAGGRYGALRPHHFVFGAGPGKNPSVGCAGDNALNDGVDFVDGLPAVAPCLFADPDADGNAVAMRASARPALSGNTDGGVLSSDVGALLGVTERRGRARL